MRAIQDAHLAQGIGFHILDNFYRRMLKEVYTFKFLNRPQRKRLSHCQQWIRRQQRMIVGRRADNAVDQRVRPDTLATQPIDKFIF